jgi:hypothetical protein
MTHRTPIARIAVDDNELVISVGAGAIDMRLWTPTGGIRFPSKHGMTFPAHCVREVLDAPRSTMGGKK